MLLQMTVTAMITSMNPSITARQNTGEDSEQVSTLFCKSMGIGLLCTCNCMQSGADMPEIRRSQCRLYADSCHSAQCTLIATHNRCASGVAYLSSVIPSGP